MDSANELALLALVVALIALIISSWQLAQALFATAIDGKRFCQGSIMGIWARKTRLNWRWSQVRFELNYTIPDIRLSSAIYDEEAPFLSKRLFYRLPVISWFTEVIYGPVSDWEQYFEITTTEGHVPWELRKTRVKYPPSAENASATEAWSMRLVGIWDSTFTVYSPDTVSWLMLLRRIYHTQVKAIDKINAAHMNGNIKDEDMKAVELGNTDIVREVPCANMTVHESDQGEDRVVVKLVERSWDLVPPDVVRPLAQSTVGTMIVIAHRFGMNWLDDFDPTSGHMNASGCGHTFSSEAVRGLGTVLLYSYSEATKRAEKATAFRRSVATTDRLAPTITADKLHCGVLPIDPSAISTSTLQEDIYLIDSSRKVELRSLLLRLGVISPEYDQLRDSKRHNEWGAPGWKLKHGIEEAVSILCPIAALPESKARWVMWPFRNMRQPFTPMRQSQGIAAFKDLFAPSLAGSPHAMKVMEQRTGHLKHLSRSPIEYLEELYDSMQFLQDSRHTTDRDELEQIHHIYARICQIHSETSEVFKSIPTPDTVGDEDPRPFILDISAAQVTLATRYGIEADKIAMDGSALNNGDSKTGDMETRLRFVQELARLYVEDLDKGSQSTIIRHLRRRGYKKLERPEIKALWWTMVVRSVCWWTSVRIKLPETQIPSYWYNSRAPVYIT